MKDIKRVDLAEIRQLLGDSVAERITTAILRNQALGIREVSVDDLLLALQYVREPETINHKSRGAFARVAAKYIIEFPKARKAFLTWCSKMQKGVKK